MTERRGWCPGWTKGDGPDADVVISTRARLARSLLGYAFPSRADARELTEIAELVKEASAGLACDFPGIRAVEVDSLTLDERALLLDAHIASIQQLSGGAGRIVLMEPSGTLSVMVNEEDHLRLQVLVSGLAPRRAYDVVDHADDLLGARLPVGFDELFGYLTADVSNVGTGLRVSVLIHLGATLASGALSTRLRAVTDLGVSVRGLFGEGTRSMGDLFQVSNEVTLGLSEGEIVERVDSVARYLVREERLARKELLDGGRNLLMDRASKALRVLRHSHAITGVRAIDLMSPLRLAVELGLVAGCSRTTLNELLADMRVGAGDDIDLNRRRASVLRERLAQAQIAGA